MKKFLCSAIALVAGFALAVPGVSAHETYGTVADNSGKDSLKSDTQPTIAGQETAEVTLTYDGAELQYVKADGDRKGESAWIGTKVIAPTSVNDETPAKNAKISYKLYGGSWKEAGNFYDAKDGEWYTTVYSAVTKEELAEAAKNGVKSLVVCEWKFEWAEGKTQLIKIAVNPMNTTVLSKVEDGGKEIFTPAEAAKIKAEADKAKQEATAKDDNALDNVPKTGSSLPIALIGLLGLATLTGAYSLRLAYNRK